MRFAQEMQGDVLWHEVLFFNSCSLSRVVRCILMVKDESALCQIMKELLFSFLVSNQGATFSCLLLFPYKEMPPVVRRHFTHCIVESPEPFLGRAKVCEGFDLLLLTYFFGAFAVECVPSTFIFAMNKKESVTLYSLSTCVYCKAIQKMLEDLAVEHQCIQADELAESEREAVIQEFKTLNPQCSFPTVVVGETVIAGYHPQELKEILGIVTEVDRLYESLRKINEPQEYFFNRNKEKTFELLRSLLINKERYGYMVCPCRLASGERNKDRDILCPCDYREADVREFGSCYCGLYVSEEYNSGKRRSVKVPERRDAALY